VGKKEVKRPLGRPRRRCVGNIKMDLRERAWDGMDWINLLRIGTRGRHLKVVPDRGKRFSVLKSVQTESGAQPAFYSMGIGVRSFAGTKWSGHVTDRSPPDSAEIENDATPPYVFMAYLSL
jgi:hypothetical protein